MKVYRIAKFKYLSDLSGFGAKQYGGRWNTAGNAMLYTSENLSLAVLEILANQKRQLLNQEYGYIEIDIPESTSFLKITKEERDQEWRRNRYSSETIAVGTEWLQSNSSLSLFVPSAVLSQEQNILVNPNHSEFSKIEIVKKGILNLDGRVIS